jgi:hypothetical protein
LASIALLAAIALAGKEFSFVYRRPLIYSVAGLLTVVAIVGIGVGQTSIHLRIGSFMEGHGVPGGRHLYERYWRPPFDRAGSGIIVDMGVDGFILETRRGELLLVATTSETQFPLGETLQVGDTVVVMGDRDIKNNIIRAEGIAPFTPPAERM